MTKRRFVIWGGTYGMESHRWIHYGFSSNARKLGHEVRWVPDEKISRETLTPGTIVISADVWNRNIGPAAPGVDYVLHNYDASHELCQTVQPEHFLRLQVWTYDAAGENWDTCRVYNRENRTLFQPWGTDILTEEFMDPIFNPLSTDVIFVGAIWGEISEHHGEMGNVEAIAEMEQTVQTHGLTFKHHTQISERQMTNLTRSSRLAPAIAGRWQVRNGYLPCRAFKNSSYGALMITNVPAVQALYEGSTLHSESVDELIKWGLRLKKKEAETLIKQQQVVTRRYTYRESIETIMRALNDR